MCSSLSLGGVMATRSERLYKGGGEAGGGEAEEAAVGGAVGAAVGAG